MTGSPDIAARTFERTDRRRLVRTAAALLGSRAVFGLVNLAAASVATAAVGLEAFGAVVLCHAVARLVGDTLRFQSWQAILRYGAPMLDRGDGGGLRHLVGLTLRLDAAALAVALAGLLAAAPLLGEALAWPEPMQDWVRFYALAAIFMTSATPTGVLRLIDRFDVLNWQNGLNATIRLAGSAAVLALGLGVDALFAVWFLAATVSGGWMMARAAALWTAALRALPEGPATPPALPGFWRFAISTNLSVSLSAGLTHGSMLAVGAVLGPAAAALYAIARQISEAIAKPARLLGPVVMPAFAEGRNGPDGALRLLGWTLASGGVAMVAAIAVTLLFGRLLLETLFGAEALAAHALMVLSATAAAVTLSGFALQPALLAAGRAGLSLAISAVAAAVYVAALALLLPTAGLTGAGAALLAHAVTLFLGRLVATLRVVRGPSAADLGKTPSHA